MYIILEKFSGGVIISLLNNLGKFTVEKFCFNRIKIFFPLVTIYIYDPYDFESLPSCTIQYTSVYYCTYIIIFNSYLSVSPEGSVSASPSTSNVFVGGNETFTCSSMGGAGNVFTWIRLYDSEMVGNMSVLTVSVVGANNGGVYRCVVVNNAGNDSDTVTLNGEKFINLYISLVGRSCSSVF